MSIEYRTTVECINIRWQFILVNHFEDIYFTTINYVYLFETTFSYLKVWDYSNKEEERIMT